MSSSIRRQEYWAYPFISLIATIFNWPLARFPHQDSMYNDQILLNRTSWIKAALMENLGASVDFTQGLGANYLADIKVIPHFFDPAAFFLLFLSPFWALALRNMFLVFICIYFLDKLWNLYFKKDKERDSKDLGLKIGLILFYIFSPQFFQEVGHHFVAIFYALPLLIYTTHQFSQSPRFKNCFGLILAQTLFSNLADLHIAFFLPIIFVFMLLFDHTLGKNHLKYFLFAFLAFSLIALLSHAGPIQQVLFKSVDIVRHSSPWDLPTYWNHFLSRVYKTFLTPRFANPVGLYILPLLGLIFIGLKFRSQAPSFFKDLKVFSFFAFLLFALGLVLHGIPQLRNFLPSALRYHLICLPFLFTILLIMHNKDLTQLINKLKQHPQYLKLSLKIVFSIFFIITIIDLKIPKNYFFAFHSYVFNPDLTMAKLTILFARVALPMLYLGAIFYGNRAIKKFSALTFSIFMAITIASTYSILRVSHGHNFSYISSPTYNDLYRDFPHRINTLISQSPYSWAPRSFIANAVGLPRDPNRGRNDKLLPIIEYPESLNGRMFFQWRYSYTRHTSQLYSQATQRGPVVFYPPGPDLIDQTIALAQKVEAPFLISADTKFQHPDLKLLGHFELADIVNPEKLKLFNHGLVGNAYIYAIKTVIKDLQNGPFSSSEYSRVNAYYRGLKSTLPEIKLPLTYIEGIEVFNENGQAIEATKNSEGFVVVKNDGSFKDLKVTSWSPLGLIAFATPFLGLLLLLLLTGLDNAITSRRRMGD